jgi:hypothetical protein
MALRGILERSNHVAPRSVKFAGARRGNAHVVLPTGAERCGILFRARAMQQTNHVDGDGALGSRDGLRASSGCYGA